MATNKVFSRDFSKDYSVEIEPGSLVYNAYRAFDRNRYSNAYSFLADSITVTLPSSQSIDHLWLKSNIKDGSLEYSTNGTDYTSILTITDNLETCVLFNFTSTDAKYWRLNFTETNPTDAPQFLIYETRLLSEATPFANNLERLQDNYESIRNETYSLINDRKTETGKTPLWRGSMTFSHADQSLVDLVRGYVRDCTQFVIMPEPETYPEHIYECYIPDFSFDFDNQVMPSGFSGTVRLIEV